MSKHSQSPLLNLVETLIRHRKKMVLIPLLSIGAGLIVLLFFPRTYHSEAVLFLQVGRESVGIDPTATTGQTIALQQTGRDDEVRSAVDLIRSRGVLSKVVDRLTPEVVLGQSSQYAAEPNMVAELASATIGRVVGVMKDLDKITPREEALIELEESLIVETERGSTAIEVEIESDTPQLAKKLLECLVDVFEQEHARVHRNQSSKAFFLDQREKLRQELDEAKTAVRDAKDSMGIASVAGRRSSLENQVSVIEGEKYSTEQELSTALARVNELRDKLSNTPERVATARTVMPNEGADLLRQELYSLQIRKADLEARYQADHPLVVAVSNQVEEAKRVVEALDQQREQSVDDVNPVYQDLSLSLKQQETLLAGYESRLGTLNEQLQKVLQDLKVLNANELKIDKLEREVRTREAKFFQYDNSMQQARIDQELEEQQISNVAILQPPLLLEKPVSPSKMMMVLASLMLAIVGTAASVISSERLNDTLRDGDEASEILGLPVFAEIPETSQPLAKLAH